MLLIAQEHWLISSDVMRQQWKGWGGSRGGRQDLKAKEGWWWQRKGRGWQNMKDGNVMEGDKGGGGEVEGVWKVKQMKEDGINGCWFRDSIRRMKDRKEVRVHIKAFTQRSEGAGGGGVRKEEDCRDNAGCGNKECTKRTRRSWIQREEWRDVIRRKKRAFNADKSLHILQKIGNCWKWSAIKNRVY